MFTESYLYTTTQKCLIRGKRPSCRSILAHNFQPPMLSGYFGSRIDRYFNASFFLTLLCLLYSTYCICVRRDMCQTNVCWEKYERQNCNTKAEGSSLQEDTFAYCSIERAIKNTSFCSIACGKTERLQVQIHVLSTKTIYWKLFSRLYYSYQLIVCNAQVPVHAVLLLLHILCTDILYAIYI